MGFYSLLLEPDDDTILVTCKDFPELTTFGDNREDALKHALNALEEAIAGRIADGQDVPLSQVKPIGEDWVEVPVMVELKAALYRILKARNLSRADLQRAMNLPHREQVDRLLRLDHNTHVETVLNAFKALGMPVDIRIPGVAA